MNDIIRTLQFEKEQLEARIRLLEDKIESDNRQISEYDAELREAKKLLNEAVPLLTEVMRDTNKCVDCIYDNDNMKCPEGDNCWRWIYDDRFRKLIGGVNYE